MNESDRWRQFAQELSMDFVPGLAPYLEKSDLLSKLHGKKVDVDLELIQGMLGGFLESMVAKMFVGIISGQREDHEILIYRDVKHRLRSSGGSSDEYYMNCALVFPTGHQTDFSIVRGRRILTRNKVKFEDSTLDKLCTCTCKNPGSIRELLHSSDFKTGISTLFEKKGAFTVGNAGIFFGMKNRLATVELLLDAIDRMTAVAHSLGAKS
jgi:hypothetical protein